MYLRGDISILVPAIFRTIVAILTAPAVFSKLERENTERRPDTSLVYSDLNRIFRNWGYYFLLQVLHSYWQKNTERRPDTSLVCSDLNRILFFKK